MKITIAHDLKAGTYSSDDARITLDAGSGTDAELTLDFQFAAPPVVDPPDDPEPPKDPPVDPPKDPDPPVDPPVDPPKDPPPPTPIPDVPANDNDSHVIVLTVVDGAGHEWAARAVVGNDLAAAAQYLALADAAGIPHPGLTAWFYADCVEVGATRLDNAYDYINCKTVTVTYDGQPAPVPPSSKADGTFDFWRGCRSPAIRYGKQVGWSADGIDWSLLPSYALDPQVPWDDSKKDYSFNGYGNCTTWTMGQGGSRPDIGYMPTWNMAFLCNPSDATWAVVRRTEDHIGGWGGVYFSDPETGRIVDIHKYPNTTTLPQAQVSSYKNNALVPYLGSYDGDTLIPAKGAPKSWSTTASPMVPDSDHLTGYALLAAMVTGTARDRDHASFWGNYTLIGIGPQYTAAGGCAMGAQRRFAWCLRTLFMASYVSSDRQYFADEVARNLPIALAAATNPFGIYDVMATYPRDPADADGYRGMATWQQFYLSIVVSAVARKNPEWLPFAQFLAKFIRTWHEYPFYFCMTTYFLMCFEPDTKTRMTDFRAMVNMSMTQNGYSQATADAITQASTVEEAFAAFQAAATDYDGKCVDGSADYLGTIHDPEAYPAMADAATACALDSGLEGMDVVRQRYLALPTRPNYSRDQIFHIVPRAA